ncbi:MAG: thioredoxin family protein [Candidatus Promineifilaceae bacterium]
MVERIVLVFLLALAGTAVYWAFKYRHMHRLQVDLTPDRPTVLYFRNDNCGPCMTQAHYLEILEKQYQDKFAMQKIDTDLDPDKAAKYGVFTLPTTLVIDRQGDVKYINYGLTNTFRLSRQLESVV